MSGEVQRSILVSKDVSEILDREKKRAGRTGTRGSYVDRAVRVYEDYLANHNEIMENRQITEARELQIRFRKEFVNAHIRTQRLTAMLMHQEANMEKVLREYDFNQDKAETMALDEAEDIENDYLAELDKLREIIRKTRWN